MQRSSNSETQDDGMLLWFYGGFQFAGQILVATYVILSNAKVMIWIIGAVLTVPVMFVLSMCVLMGLAAIMDRL